MMADDFDHLHRLLADDSANADIVPSSGFTKSVMDALQRAGSAPPPIPFPWTRLWPSFATLGVLLGAMAFGVLKLPMDASIPPIAMPPALQSTLGAMASPESAWTLAAVLIASLSTMVAVRSGDWLRRR
jgi:hypothetical protein